MAGQPPMTEVVVGRIGRAHGILGEVSVAVHTDEPDRRFAPGVVLRPDPSSRPRLTVETVRPHGDRLLVRFAEVPDRTVAESLRGASLLVEVGTGSRPDDPEEFYDHQLVGLRVRVADGREVGTVSEVRHLPAQDLLALDLDDGTGPALVPFVAALVPEVDVDAGWLRVEELPGLLDGLE